MCNWSPQGEEINGAEIWGNDGPGLTETDESYSSWRFKKPCEHQVGKTQSKPYLGILVKMDKTQIQEKNL